MAVIGAIIVALIISSIFYFALNSRGPWGSFWSFFLVIMLAVWAASIWIVPVGYVYWEIAWIPLFFIGLIIGLLLAAVSASSGKNYYRGQRGDVVDADMAADERQKTSETEENTFAAIGVLFWLFIGLMILAIIVGYALDPGVNVVI